MIKIKSKKWMRGGENFKSKPGKMSYLIKKAGKKDGTWGKV